MQEAEIRNDAIFLHGLSDDRLTLERGLKLSENMLKKDLNLSKDKLVKKTNLTFRTSQPECDLSLSLTSYVTLEKFINIFDYLIFLL